MYAGNGCRASVVVSMRRLRSASVAFGHLPRGPATPRPDGVARERQRGQCRADVDADMPAKAFSACRRTPGQRTCCPALPPPLPACSRRKAARRRGAGDRRKPSPHGPPPATSRPSETWERPGRAPKSPAARRWPAKSPAQAALPRKCRDRARRRSAAGSRRPSGRSRVPAARIRPEGPGPIGPFPQHGITDAQSPHEYCQHGGRRGSGGTE